MIQAPAAEVTRAKLLALCIEHVDASDPNERYVSCVAIPGRAPGLRIDGRGKVLWRRDDGAAFELWVSADDRLVLWRLEAGERVVVTRANRSLDGNRRERFVALMVANHRHEKEVSMRSLTAACWEVRL